MSVSVFVEKTIQTVSVLVALTGHGTVASTWWLTLADSVAD